MSDTFVYFLKPVGLPGPVKIGCSKVPRGRLEQMATWSPVPLEIVVCIPGDYHLERNLHECFADIHSHREWFNTDDRLTRLIDDLKCGVAVANAINLSDRKGSIRGKVYVARKPWGAGRRAKAGWVFKCHAALKRAIKERGTDLWMPEQIWDLITHHLGDDEGQRAPTAEDTSALIAFCDDPVALAQTYEQRFPNDNWRAA